MTESAATNFDNHHITPLNSAVPAGPFDPLKSGHPRNGKIAQMPREQRDALNQMLSNGATYDSIIEHFHSFGTDLNRQNITNWKSGGYQDWLAQQEWVAEINHHSDWASELSRSGGSDDTALHQGVIRLAIIQIFKSLKSEQLKDDPANYTRMLNTLARLSRESICIRKYIDAVAEARAALAPMKDPRRELSDEDRAAMVHHVDRVLGLVPDKPWKPAPPRAQEEPPAETAIQSPETPAPPITSEQEHSSHGHGPIASPPCEASSNPIDPVPDLKVVMEEPPPPRAETTETPPIESQSSIQCTSASSEPEPHPAPIPDSRPAPELCGQCQQELPPLLPNGERPDNWCSNCLTPLPPPPAAPMQPCNDVTM